MSKTVRKSRVYQVVDAIGTLYGDFEVKAEAIKCADERVKHPPPTNLWVREITRKTIYNTNKKEKDND